MYILGISAFYHDSAACLLKDGEIVAAAQEERFTRKKHDSSFPSNAINYCLREAGISSTEIMNVVFYEKPFVKFERLIETYLAFAPKGFKSFAVAMPGKCEDIYSRRSAKTHTKHRCEINRTKILIYHTKYVIGIKFPASKWVRNARN